MNHSKGDDEQSALTSAGHEPFLPTYEDNRTVRLFSTLAIEVVLRKIDEYEEFVAAEKRMPRAKELGERILLHLKFERDYHLGTLDIDRGLGSEREPTSQEG